MSIMTVIGLTLFGFFALRALIPYAPKLLCSISIYKYYQLVKWNIGADVV